MEVFFFLCARHEVTERVSDDCRPPPLALFDCERLQWWMGSSATQRGKERSEQPLIATSGGFLGLQPAAEAEREGAWRPQVLNSLEHRTNGGLCHHLQWRRGHEEGR